MDGAAEAGAILGRVRSIRPLVHHITNLVVMNDTANVTLAVGALPVMAHAREEVEEMTSAAGALVLNIGTLTVQWIESMLAAGRAALDRGIPIVLDPVGAGATRLRTESALRLLREVRPTVVRGNLGELASLVGLGGLVRGVESLGAGASPGDVAQAVAREWRCVAAVTGARDHVAGGGRMLVVDNGHARLTGLTGTGCMATTVIACFLAVRPDPLIGAAAGLACFGLAAERAAETAAGPGSYRTALLDALAMIDPSVLAAGARIAEWPAPPYP